MLLFNKYFGCLIFLGVIVLLLPAELDAACVCAEKGSDYCAGCSGRLVVRPKKKHSDGSPDIDLSPIGDKCWCTKKMIEPAALPKIVSKKKPCDCCKSYNSCTCGKSCSCGKSSESSSSSSCDSSSTIFSSTGSSSYVVPQANYVPTVVNNDDSMPADPISVSLAIQAGKAIEVPEAKLAYGFVQKPLDGLPKVYISSVKEENLYALNSDVITLKKKTSSSSSKKTEEEYPDAEEEEAAANAAADEEDEQPRLTYKQLGYVAEQYKNPTFERVESSYVSSSSGSNEPSVVNGKVSVDCGYRPGRISTVRKTKPKSYSSSCS